MRITLNHLFIISTTVPILCSALPCELSQEPQLVRRAGKYSVVQVDGGSTAESTTSTTTTTPSSSSTTKSSSTTSSPTILVTTQTIVQTVKATPSMTSPSPSPPSSTPPPSSSTAPSASSISIPPCPSSSPTLQEFPSPKALISSPPYPSATGSRTPDDGQYHTTYRGWNTTSRDLPLGRKRAVLQPPLPTSTTHAPSPTASVEGNVFLRHFLDARIPAPISTSPVDALGPLSPTMRKPLTLERTEAVEDSLIQDGARNYLH